MRVILFIMFVAIITVCIDSIVEVALGHKYFCDTLLGKIILGD